MSLKHSFSNKLGLAIVALPLLFVIGWYLTQVIRLCSRNYVISEEDLSVLPLTYANGRVSKNDDGGKGNHWGFIRFQTIYDELFLLDYNNYEALDAPKNVYDDLRVRGAKLGLYILKANLPRLKRKETVRVFDMYLNDAHILDYHRINQLSRATLVNNVLVLPLLVLLTTIWIKIFKKGYEIYKGKLKKRQVIFIVFYFSLFLAGCAIMFYITKMLLTLF